jgi:hypothetical protein
MSRCVWLTRVAAGPGGLEAASMPHATQTTSTASPDILDISGILERSLLDRSRPMIRAALAAHAR